MKPTNYYNKIISTLKELHSSYPECTIGKHLATALDGYTDLWPLTDAEIYIALRRYAADREFDVPNKNENVEEIIKDGMNLNKFREELLEEEE